jgi:hypothetical protein
MYIAKTCRHRDCGTVTSKFSKKVQFTFLFDICQRNTLSVLVDVKVTIGLHPIAPIHLGSFRKTANRRNHRRQPVTDCSALCHGMVHLFMFPEKSEICGYSTCDLNGET